MIAATFISRNDDWMLPHKLRVLSIIADRVCVLLDRSPQSEAICRRFPMVEVRHWQNTMGVDHLGNDGPHWEEGAMRQAAWDWVTDCNPRWVVLGDTDEIPTPGFATWLLNDMVVDNAVKCWYADWVNLFGDAGHAIGGITCAWSYQNARANKKAVLVRHERGQTY